MFVFLEPNEPQKNLEFSLGKRRRASSDPATAKGGEISFSLYMYLIFIANSKQLSYPRLRSYNLYAFSQFRAPLLHFDQTISGRN